MKNVFNEKIENYKLRRVNREKKIKSNIKIKIKKKKINMDLLKEKFELLKLDSKRKYNNISL
jgi:hypothetical protein